MSLPTLTATGNLTAEPELRFTPSGKSVTTFTIACNDRRKDQTTGQWIDGDTTFLTCEVWGERGEELVEQVGKGQRVMVTGKLRQRSYEAKDGTKRTVYELAHCDVYLAPKRQPRPSQDFGQAEPFTPSTEAAPF